MTKKILITGATRGIGKKIFEEMLSVGDVFVIAKNRELLNNLKILGAKDVLSCDLSSHAELAKDFIVENEINVLINNAGIYSYSELDKEEEESINDIIKTNVVAPIKLSKYVLNRMKNNSWGRIINIGSISGVIRTLRHLPAMWRCSRSCWQARSCVTIRWPRNLKREHIRLKTLYAAWCFSVSVFPRRYFLRIRWALLRIACLLRMHLAFSIVGGVR